MCINSNSSSNTNETIKTILDFFIQKFTSTKSTKRLQVNKNKNVPKEHLRRKSQLFAYLRFVFFPVCLYAVW